MIAGLYKYVYKGEIIYIGMSCSDIEARLWAHSREDRFKKFIKDCKIYYIPLSSDIEIKAYEKVLILKYKPILNIQDVNESQMTIDVEKLFPEWLEWEGDFSVLKIGSRKFSLKSNESIKRAIKCIEDRISNIDSYIVRNDYCFEEIERVLNISRELYIDDKHPACIKTSEEKMVKSVLITQVDNDYNQCSILYGGTKIGNNFFWELNDIDSIKNNYFEMKKQHKDMIDYREKLMAQKDELNEKMSA